MKSKHIYGPELSIVNWEKRRTMILTVCDKNGVELERVVAESEIQALVYMRDVFKSYSSVTVHVESIEKVRKVA